MENPARNEVNNDPKKGPLVSVWGEQAAGLGGVWATENTREGIWDALKRKEVYATTGDRPAVRVFAGWDFVKADLDRPDFAANGYAHGVPMGGDLINSSAGKAPVFLIHAMRDPMVPTSTAFRSLRDGLAKTVSLRNESLTWWFPAVARLVRMADARSRWVTPWI